MMAELIVSNMLKARESDLKDVYLAAFERENPDELDIDVGILNTSDQPKDLKLSLGAFQGDSDGLLDLGSSGHKTVTVAPKSFYKIDHFSDEGQLDFMTAYNIRVGGSEFLAEVSGRSLGRDSWVDIPLLGQRGFLGRFEKVGK